MKNVDLIEVTDQELGGVMPTPGSEIIIRNTRYRIVHGRPPRTPSCWRRGKQEEAGWRLLVEKIDEPTC